MGHVCSILIFDATMSKDEITDKCFDWQFYNCDLMEYGGGRGSNGPQMSLKWTSMKFDSRAKAEEYLDKTFGDYDQTAVRFTENGKEYWAVACEVHH